MTSARSPADRHMIAVWDPLVRIGHWALLVFVVAAWLTRHSTGSWHEWTGYAALFVVLVRVVWGCAGSHYARFGSFLCSIGITLRYARAILHGTEARHIGHNPLGGWMIAALLTTVAMVGFTGWLYTTDRYWGIEWVGNLHNQLTNVLIILVALHVAGVLFASFRHRENLVKAMLHGKKRDK